MPSVPQTIAGAYFRPHSIYSLPVEIFVDITCYAITGDNTNPSCLSAVCSRWRATINNDPRLWTTLVLWERYGQRLVVQIKK
jgi:hypothetical protein